MIARHRLTLREALLVTLDEFSIYMTAYAIQQEERRYNAAIQAWFNQSAKATKGKGKQTKSAYRNFQEFYDHQKEFHKLFEPDLPQERRLNMAEKNRLINKRKED